ncbi:MAG TPA: hypothetical protein DCG53_03675 [Syntrophus sp. (in: bacteria)]|nr:hypothetical protein [Syntrophus sp. (in: bacteria)]
MAKEECKPIMAVIPLTICEMCDLKDMQRNDKQKVASNCVEMSLILVGLLRLFPTEMQHRKTKVK